MAKRISLRPAHWAWLDTYSFEAGVKVGDMIWVSGQAAVDANGNIVGAGDMRAQADKTFQNVAEVLAEGGATMDDVVSITAWLTDMSLYADYNAARAAAFPNTQPTSATVHSAQLVLPGLLVEVAAVAILGAR